MAAPPGFRPATPEEIDQINSGATGTLTGPPPGFRRAMPQEIAEIDSQALPEMPQSPTFENLPYQEGTPGGFENLPYMEDGQPHPMELLSAEGASPGVFQAPQNPMEMPGIGDLNSNQAPLAPPPQQQQPERVRADDIAQQAVRDKALDDWQIPNAIDQYELSTGEKAVGGGEFGAANPYTDLSNLKMDYIGETDPKKKKELLAKIQEAERMNEIGEKDLARRRERMEELGLSPLEYKVLERTDPLKALESWESVRAKMDAAAEKARAATDQTEKQKWYDEVQRLNKERQEAGEQAKKYQQDPTERLMDFPVVRGIKSAASSTASVLAETTLRLLPGESELARKLARHRSQDAAVEAAKNKHQGKIAGYVQQGTEMMTKYAAVGAVGYVPMLGFVHAESAGSAYVEGEDAGLSGAALDLYANAIGAANAAFTVAGGKLAGKFGARTVEEMMKRPIGRSAPTGFWKFTGKFAAGAGTETFAEEIPTYIVENTLDYSFGVQEEWMPETWKEDMFDIAVVSSLMQVGTVSGEYSQIRNEYENYERFGGPKSPKEQARFDAYLNAIDKTLQDNGRKAGKYTFKDEQGNVTDEFELHNTPWQNIKNVFLRPNKPVDVETTLGVDTNPFALSGPVGPNMALRPKGPSSEWGPSEVQPELSDQQFQDYLGEQDPQTQEEYDQLYRDNGQQQPVQPEGQRPKVRMAPQPDAQPSPVDPSQQREYELAAQIAAHYGVKPADFDKAVADAIVTNKVH